MTPITAPHSDDTRTAGAIARPPLLFLGALLAGLALDHLLRLPFPIGRAGWPHWVSAANAFCLIAAGIAIFVAAIRGFARAATPVQGTRPTRALVTSGIHCWSRSPIYLAMFLVHVGIGLMIRSPWILILTLPLAVTMRLGVVAREEALAAAVERGARRRRQDVGVGPEILERPVERDRAATVDPTRRLALGAGGELARPPEIAVGAQLEQEDVDLLVDNTAGVAAGVFGALQGDRRGAALFAQAGLRVEPRREVEILALVPDLDAGATEIAEARYFLPQLPGDGADHGDGRASVEAHPGIGEQIRGGAEITPPLQQVSVLALDLAATHGLTPATP